jgi:predicted small metal-binding protein
MAPRLQQDIFGGSERMKKRVDCDCGWSYESEVEDDLVSAVQRHAKEVHNLEGVTREQALAQAKPVAA